MKTFTRKPSTALAGTFLWQPSPIQKLFMTAGLTVLTYTIAYLHYSTGFAYEFNILYTLPVFVSAWFLGNTASFIIILVCLTNWIITDVKLAGAQAGLLPLIFNTTTRALTLCIVTLLIKRLRRALEEEWNNSRKDALTGLFNRRYFYELGSKFLEVARRQDFPVSIAFMDLDHFKEVNDSLGHAAGDALLRCVSSLMGEHFRAEDVLARLGGDEFAVIMPGMQTADAKLRLETFRSKLLAVMGKHHWPVTISIGAVSYATVHGGLDALLSAADTAMYQAKQAGRDTIVILER